ncbi:OLC1v1006317C1 [Oldenlandia corymbosa var. corymbosa]|uniref:OLC1v1006317C1 n=1 Tax=Oldenlandia corymbosa var. corymbosa TaxID=529605 RepID=A0AAV1DH18_OLDCO|nr:OLC1v1006317C1 [Oldenlandia corymbosa var. corymbosa]
MAKKEGEVVCVTGGSGYIGSWLVTLLLQRGYSVHATVKDLKDEKETKHLEEIEGAESRLRLFQIDLLNYDSIVAAVTGTTGVFHLASPCIVDEVSDPQSQLLDPALKGTINVLTAAKEFGVRRVVITSSVSAIHPSPNWPSDKVKNEECWTDEDYCRRDGVWYPLSKTLAEKAAWEFAKEKGLDIVVVNPGTVMGPIIPPSLNASMLMVLRLLQGCTETYQDFFMGSVHVKDVALAHILVYENPLANGRHLCVEAISHFSDFAAKVAELCPEYDIPQLPKDTQPGLLRVNDASKKLIDLGLNFIPMEQIIKDSNWGQKVDHNGILPGKICYEDTEGEVVCVTGGSGYIGSCLMSLLLQRGYSVHATVKDLKDEKETKHLEELQGAESRLRLFQIDLLNYDSIAAAITGTTGVFHLASPNSIDEVGDPQKELLDPALKGTINVLTAAKELGVWYPLSKTLAEKAAWEFAKEKGLDIVVINPGAVMGPFIPPSLSASMLVILRLLQGSSETYEDFFIGCVHIKDVALAHILVYENSSARGRHLCVEAISHYSDFAAKVAELCPEYNVPRLPKDTQPGVLRDKDASKKLLDLGLNFIPVEQIIKESVESLKMKGFLP